MQNVINPQEASALIKGLDIKIWIAMFAAIASFIASIVAGIISFVNNNKQINEKRKEERRKEIYKQLNDFYGPFQQHLNTSNELYKIFFIGKPKEFRVLTYFLNPDQIYTFPDNSQGKVILTSSDKQLLEQIFSIGQKLQDLIVEKSGLVESKELRYSYTPNTSITDVTLNGNGLLAIAKTHFQLIKLAAEGKFVGEVDRIKNYVFPRELPIKIEENIITLQAELKKI